MRNTFYISFGVWVAIIPLLGIPGFWKNIFVIGSGLFLVLVSAGPELLKSLKSKPPVKKKLPKTSTSQNKINQPQKIANEKNEPTDIEINES